MPADTPPSGPDSLSRKSSRWHFWIDRGGTFTDVVARRPDGRLVTAKLLSEDPRRAEDAAIAAMRQLTGAGDGPLPPADIRMGTTVATNALLERTVEPTLLAITRGFGDALAIGYQDRPDLFARAIRLPPPLYAGVEEMVERVGADGRVIVPLDEAAAAAAFDRALAAGMTSIAIVLMHGYRYPAHEERLAQLARQAGFARVATSHDVAPLVRLVARGDTTVVDACLSPVLRRYVDRFVAALGPGAAPLFMQSSGGLAAADRFSGKDAILSGPAGGIVGMARTASASGAAQVIGFDMGGTSTDVSHFAGNFERDSETRVAGARIRTPMLRIHTVAAGGGSVCRYDAGRFVVGPASAGAVPGPAAYGRGGPLTVTDCNVVLGKVRPDHFPHLFGPDGNGPLDDAAPRRLLADIAKAVEADSGRVMSAEAIAEGFVGIAVANMANAIKTISVARGHDVTACALACFGGAGGQHACHVADALGVRTVLIHPLAGVLSAYGMGLASQSAVRERSCGLGVEAANDAALAQAAAMISAEARAALGTPADRVVTTAFVRRTASESAIELPLGGADALAAGFATAHRAQFGYDAAGALVIDRLRAEALVDSADTGAHWPLPDRSQPPLETAACYLGGRHVAVPLYQRAGLAAGFAADGPAIIVDPLSTTMVEPDWRVTVDSDGTLRMERQGAASLAVAAEEVAEADPVRLEIFNGLFMAIAEEMGSALARSASSVNIRERLDFSCAVFDAAGRLVANAPHMPVHLGSMGESVAAILRRRGPGPDGRPRDGRGILSGDAYVLNAPYEGGTHLPDITVIAPVFVDGDGPDAPPRFFVAARGHHADVGGISPGSMPPNSRSVEDEGVLLDNVLLVDRGRFDEAGIRALLGAGRWPSRNIDQNVADLAAQLAACARGAQGLCQAAADHGADVVSAYMAHVQANAAQAVRRLIGRLSDGRFACPMDNGAVIRVAVRVDREGGHVDIDFAGTSAQLADNFNAPLPVVRAAVMYVLRTMIDDPVPMNEGCLAPVRIHVPAGSMLSPAFPAAVVAGNVETSQAVTDALFGAFGALAASQGTMNNFTFGDATHQYYETIAGGAGAGPGFAGADAVQTHMTNSRLTDPEVLEDRFPVLVDHFAIRRRSGGRGRWRGGDGVVRALRFLVPMRAGILSNRRDHAPFGLDGGGDALPGRNAVVRSDGKTESLGAIADIAVGPGDMMVIETPGGGGFGAHREQAGD